MIEQKIYLVEKYIEREFKAGNIPGSVHLSIGQQFYDAKYANFDGWVLGNHRSHGQYIARTDDIEGLLDQVYRGMSQHLYYSGCFLTTGIQGALAGVAVGLASQGESVRCFIGDGTVNQGILWEALGICEGLDVLFIIYDNFYSMSETKKGWLHKKIGFHPNVRYISGVERLCGHSGNDTQAYRLKKIISYCEVRRDLYEKDISKEILNEVNQRIHDFEIRNKRDFTPLT